MDLYCPICAEPIDNDELHEVAEANRSPLPTTYSGVAADFRTRGCAALESTMGPAKHCTPTDTGRQAVMAAVYELMGDDMDGASAFLGDAEDFGLL